MKLVKVVKEWQGEITLRTEADKHHFYLGRKKVLDTVLKTSEPVRLIRQDERFVVLRVGYVQPVSWKRGLMIRKPI